MSRTKLAGYLLVAVAALNTVVDLLNGNGFEMTTHVNDVVTALSGAGFVFLRDAVAKLK